MLRRAAATVAAAMGPDDEFIVVDSASAIPVDPVYRAQVIRLDRPGANRARNAGWRASSNEMVLYLDDDVMVDPGWADAFVAALGAHPEAAFVTGRIDVPPEQAPVDSPVAIKNDPGGAVLTKSTVGVLGHSASLAVRRSALESVGGFDEVLGAGGRLPMSDETDLFDRLFAAGWTGWYEPSARAWHDQWRSRRERIRLSWLYGYGDGARIAKLRRTDRARAASLTREVFWQRGVRQAVTDGRHRYRTAFVLDVAHLAGASAGLAKARRMPVVNGHFTER
jgi:GT2 family glycosyltransferase